VSGGRSAASGVGLSVAPLIGCGGCESVCRLSNLRRPVRRSEMSSRRVTRWQQRHPDQGDQMWDTTDLDPQFGGLVWGNKRDTGGGIRTDGPHRTSDTADLLFSTLDLNICFACLSTGSVF